MLGVFLHVIVALLLGAVSPYLALGYLGFAYVMFKLSRIEQHQHAVEQALRDLKVEVTVKLPEEDMQKHFPRDIKPYLDDTSRN